MHFLDVFLLLCLLADSGPDSVAEFARMADNQLAIVERGRDPQVTLCDANGEQRTPAAWGTELLDQCAAIAALLDRNEANAPYSAATEAQRAKLADPDLTPSARILAAMRERKIPFFRFSMDQGFAHRAHFEALPLSPTEGARFQQEVVDSLAAQQAIEAADELDFDTFLQQYLTIPEAPAS
jgi:glutamate--cysteine ligase